MKDTFSYILSLLCVLWNLTKEIFSYFLHIFSLFMCTPEAHCNHCIKDTFKFALDWGLCPNGGGGACVGGGGGFSHPLLEQGGLVSGGLMSWNRTNHS